MAISRSHIGTEAYPSAQNLVHTFAQDVTALNAAVVTVTPDGAFTQIGEDEDGVNRVIQNLMYRIVPQGTTESGSWTLGTSGTWAALIVGFNEGGEFPARMIV